MRLVNILMVKYDSCNTICSYKYAYKLVYEYDECVSYIARSIHRALRR